MAGADEVIE